MNRREQTPPVVEPDQVQSEISEEEQVFVGLIEDILQSTPGLRYERQVPDASEREQNGLYAAFMIETNPAYELDVSIELSRDAFRLWVNGKDFSLPLDNRRRVERWIERRCRDVDQLVKGDLKIEVEALFGHYLSSGLFAGSDDRWVEVADRDEGWGWIGLAAWLLPFGFSPLKSDETEYRDWFEVE